jgi:CubicO group peptidase (beta-lactamase class C family)
VVDGEEITLPHYGNFLSGVAFGVSLEPFSLNNYTSYFRYNSLGKWERASGILTARVTLSNYPAETPAPDKPTALKPKPECTGNDANCRARQLAQEFLDEEQVNGLQLAVNHKGKLVLSEALGLANTEKNMPVTTTTPFKVGSISKALTSAALLKLMAENKLDLDAPVQKYVPSFPVKKYPITTRQLAGHLAGIRHYDTSSAEAHYQDMVRNQYYESATAALAIVQTDTLLFKPGTRYHYSSYGWSIIGAVLEGAGKQPYLPNMQKNIWQPLGMLHTSGAVKDSLLNVCQG